MKGEELKGRIPKAQKAPSLRSGELSARRDVGTVAD